MNESMKKYKEKIVRLELNFYLNDKDLVEWLNTKESRQSYIKELIRKDMEKEKKFDHI